MPEIPEANGEIQTIELVNEKTGEEESYVVHDVVEIEGQTYYVLQAEADEDRVLILRREGESLVTLDDEEHDERADAKRMTMTCGDEASFAFTRTFRDPASCTSLGVAQDTRVSWGRSFAAS